MKIFGTPMPAPRQSSPQTLSLRQSQPIAAPRLRPVASEPVCPQAEAPQAAAKPRIAFVGLGAIGRSRMQSLVQSNLIEAVALVEPRADQALAAQEMAPEAEIIDSFEALHSLQADGVVIATPSALHAQQAISMLQKGHAVFCQKPLGRNPKETRQIVSTAQHADRLLGLDLSYRYCDGMQQIRQLIQSRTLGDIFAVNLVFHNAFGPDKLWFYDPRLAGGGCLLDLGLHLVDTMLWALNFPKVQSVSGHLMAQDKPLTTRKTVETYAAAHLVLETGALVQLACSWRLPAGCKAMLEIAFYGTQGGARFFNSEGSLNQFKAVYCHGTTAEELISPTDSGDWAAQAALDWARSLGEANFFNGQAWQYVQVAEVLERIYEQAIVA